MANDPRDKNGAADEAGAGEAKPAPEEESAAPAEESSASAEESAAPAEESAASAEESAAAPGEKSAPATKKDDQPRVEIGPTKQPDADEEQPERKPLPAARSVSGTIDGGRSRKQRLRSDFDDASFEDDGLSGPRPPRHWGLPTWGWVLIAGIGLSVLLLVFDLRNRNRYIMVCKAKKVELHKGRTFPWPFGHYAMGGPEFKPVKIPAEADCRQRVFHNQEEAELAFLDFILYQVREALANPGTADMKQARAQVRQAMLLSRVHRSRRKEAKSMLAQLAYRAGRDGLAKAETELRRALARFQEAQKLDADRFEDLEDWINLLEELLRNIAPSPGSGAITRPTMPVVPRGGTPPSIFNPPGTIPGLPRPSGPPTSAPTEPQSPDAGPPQGGGILM